MSAAIRLDQTGGRERDEVFRSGFTNGTKAVGSNLHRAGCNWQSGEPGWAWRVSVAAVSQRHSTMW